MTIEERKNRILQAIEAVKAQGATAAQQLAELEQAYREGVNSL